MFKVPFSDESIHDNRTLEYTHQDTGQLYTVFHSMKLHQLVVHLPKEVRQNLPVKKKFYVWNFQQQKKLQLITLHCPFPPSGTPAQIFDGYTSIVCRLAHSSSENICNWTCCNVVIIMPPVAFKPQPTSVAGASSITSSNCDGSNEYRDIFTG